MLSDLDGGVKKEEESKNEVKSEGMVKTEETKTGIKKEEEDVDMADAYAASLAEAGLNVKVDVKE